MWIASVMVTQQNTANYYQSKVIPHRTFFKAANDSSKFTLIQYVHNYLAKMRTKTLKADQYTTAHTLISTQLE